MGRASKPSSSSSSSKGKKKSAARYRSALTIPQPVVRRAQDGGEAVGLAFGSGDMSQLGLSESIRERKKPTVLRGDVIAGKNIVDVSAGAIHNAVVSDEGLVYSWGCNDEGALGRPGRETGTWTADLVPGLTGVVRVRCGGSHTVALDGEGRVWTWGAYRDLTGMMGYSKSSWKKAQFEAKHVPLPRPVVSIAAGTNHVLVCLDNGELYQWGDVGMGRRQSRRTRGERLSPHIVRVKHGRKNVRCVEVFAGGNSSFALDAQGCVYAWGPNNYGQAGLPCTDEASMIVALLTRVPRLTGIVRMCAADHHTLAVNGKGQLFAFGKLAYGRLGLGEDFTSESNGFTDGPELVPHFASGSDPVVDVAVGDVHSLAVTRSGALFSWGGGDVLQLGNGEEGDQPLPASGPTISRKLSTVVRLPSAWLCNSKRPRSSRPERPESDAVCPLASF
jgi:regulator of chromosome condensation